MLLIHYNNCFVSSWFHFYRAPLSHKMKKGDGIFVHFVLPGLVGQMYEGGLWSSVNGFLLFPLSNDIYGIFILGMGRGPVQGPNEKYSIM